jgi:uncharacterized protein (DUF779 family)
MTTRVTATAPALDLLERLRARHGDLIVHLSGGCCDGSSPMCLTAAELPPGPGDTLLGEVAGAPVYVDAEQDRRWGHPALHIDVLPGAATSLSLEGADDCHLVTVAPSPVLSEARSARRPREA